LIDDEDREVRIGAMRYLCQYSVNKIETIKKFLADKDFQVKTSALMSAARESREDDSFRKNFNMKESFEEWMESFEHKNDAQQNELMKNNAARVIGTVNDPELYPYLHTLLDDDEPLKVLSAAIVSAGQTRADEFVPVLIGHLDTKMVRKYVREALAEFGENAVDALIQHLNDPNEKRNIRLGIPKVLALIGSQESVNVLIENLKHHDILLRFQIIKALNKLKAKFPILKFDEQSIEEKILDETRNYYKTLVFSNNKFSFSKGNGNAKNIKKAKKLLIHALEEKLDNNLERIFRLLGLRYYHKDMFNVYKGVVNERSDLRANAVEFLDNVLDTNLKKVILPIVETQSVDTLIDITRELHGFEIPSENGCLVSLLKGDDNWLKVCTLYLIAELRNRELLPEVEKFVNDPDPIVKETAEYTIRKFEDMKN